MNVVLLSGSPSVPSRSAWLIALARRRLEEAGATCHVLSLRDLPGQALLQADTAHPVLQSAFAQLADADAVVLATPIYKAAYSGLLKAFLDLLPQDGLRGKAVLPLATGGSIAHLLAIDYALKPVLHALGGRDIAEPVFVADAQLPRGAEGGFMPERAVTERMERALRGLLASAPALVC